MVNPKIVLFDLDYTLLFGSSKVHRDAYCYALKSVFNFSPDIYNRPIEGKIDSQILLEIALDQGLKEPVILKKMPELIKFTNEYFLANEQTSRYQLLPGAKELILKLLDLKVSIGVLTGNTAKIANWKLNTVGLLKYVKLGFFGDMALSRPLLAKLAWKKLTKTYKDLRPSDLFLIGDTRLDIECAQKIGARTIAVATGKYQPAALSKANLVVNSLVEQQVIIDFLLA